MKKPTDRANYRGPKRAFSARSVSSTCCFPEAASQCVLGWLLPQVQGRTTVTQIRANSFQINATRSSECQTVQMDQPVFHSMGSGQIQLETRSGVKGDATLVINE